MNKINKTKMPRPEDLKNFLKLGADRKKRIDAIKTKINSLGALNGSNENQGVIIKAVDPMPHNKIFSKLFFG